MQKCFNVIKLVYGLIIQLVNLKLTLSFCHLINIQPDEFVLKVEVKTS